ncbi:MAG TPA: hypothetical protein VHQ93_01835 [Chitinophagaceae bacterium]|jgi:hypothetical protein|nr:hypothetical protein [Chitinophagaceae bacterium]
MHKPFLICIILVFSLIGNSQFYYDDSALVSGSSKYLENFYNKTRHDFNVLYNGPFHYAYPVIKQGSPYFSGEAWQKGSVTYEDIIYDNVLMKYDLVKDQLIVMVEEKGHLPLELFSPRIKEFSYKDLKFIYIPRNSPLSLKEGFYHQLSKGKITALCKTENTMEQIIVDDKIEWKVNQRKKYFIIDNNHSRTINRQRDLMEAVKNHRQQISNYLKERKLKFKKNKEQVITAATDLYNKLEKQSNE